MVGKVQANNRQQRTVRCAARRPLGLHLVAGPPRDQRGCNDVARQPLLGEIAIEVGLDRILVERQNNQAQVNHRSSTLVADGASQGYELMTIFADVVVDGLVACVPFTVIVLMSFLLKPRLWLHSLPPDIQAMAAPKTKAERQLTGLMGGIVLLCFFGVPILLTWRRHLLVAGGLSSGESVAYLYGVWMVVNVWDLIGIDWPYAYWVDPARPPIPGTEGALGYKDFGFHARAFLKASVLGLAIIVPAGTAVSLLPGR